MLKIVFNFSRDFHMIFSLLKSPDSDGDFLISVKNHNLKSEISGTIRNKRHILSGYISIEIISSEIAAAFSMPI